MFAELIINVAILLGLSVLSSYLERIISPSKIKGKISIGILFGMVSIIGMHFPFTFQEGLIFDGRSIIIGIAAFFYGPVTVFFTAAISSGYRIIIGGVGTTMGISVIISSAVIGLIFFRLRIKNKIGKDFFSYLTIGFFIHIAMILLMNLLPIKITIEVIKNVTPMIFIIYIPGTILLGYLLNDQELKNKSVRLITESEEKFRLAFKTSPDSININRMKDGIFIEINDGFTKILGYTREDVIGKTSNGLHIWADENDKIKLMDGLKKYGHVDNLEAKFKTKHGKPINVLISVSVIMLDGEQHLLSITRDISEVVEAKNKLIESEKKYKTLFENSHTAMFLIDPENGNILAANPTASAFYGWPIESLIKMNVKDLNTLTKEEIQIELDLAKSEKRNHFFFNHRLANGTIKNVRGHDPLLPPMSFGGPAPIA